MAILPVSRHEVFCVVGMTGFALALSAPYTARPTVLLCGYGGRCGNPAGSPATLNGKPRQVRKEATVVVMRVPGSGWQGGLPKRFCWQQTAGSRLLPFAHLRLSLFSAFPDELRQIAAGSPSGWPAPLT